MCRYCGADVPKGRSVFYCSSQCREACERALSWPLTRRIVWDRDGHKCTRCGADLLLHDDTFKPAGLLEAQVVEVHHVVPAEQLWETACVVTREHRPEWEIPHLRAKAYAFLYHDLNNLTSLCTKPCHDEAHAELAAKPPAYVRTLDNFPTVRNP